MIVLILETKEVRYLPRLIALALIKAGDAVEYADKPRYENACTRPK
jgi:hypothetical protein